MIKDAAFGLGYNPRKDRAGMAAVIAKVRAKHFKSSAEISSANNTSDNINNSSNRGNGDSAAADVPAYPHQQQLQQQQTSNLNEAADNATVKFGTRSRAIPPEELGQYKRLVPKTGTSCMHIVVTYSCS